MASISLVMIVKNEEKILEKNLKIVEKIIDEFIIVDTGSTDSTKKIIKKYGELHEIPFVNFVETKNKALALATKDYILFMDADEKIVSGVEFLKEHADTGTECVYTKIVEGTENKISKTYLRARLWKNNGKWKFTGPGVHEVISGEGNPIITDYRVSIFHDHSHRDSAGYKKRFEKYVKIMMNYLKDNPDDTRATYYLGRTHQDLGNDLTAIMWYKKYLSYNTNYRDERWDASYNIARCWKNQGEYKKSISACEMAEKIDKRRAEIFVLLGLIYYELWDIDNSIKFFEKATSLPIPNDVRLFLNPRDYFEVPTDYLVLLYDKKKNYRKAVELTISLAKRLSVPDARIVNNLTWLKKQQDKIIFFCLGKTPENVFGSMLETQGVGGLETTYIELPTEMTKRGHTCFVFCKCEEEHVYKNTYFVPYQNIENYADLNPDVIITSRWFEPLYMFPNAKKIIWTQDAHFKNSNKPDAYQIVDGIICSSLWHRNYIAQRFGQSIPANKIHIVPLAIRKELFINKNIERFPKRVIYSSNPDRGLYILKDMWDEISEKIPNIELYITYGWEGLKTWSSSKKWLRKIEKDKNVIETWAKKSGNITLTGRLSKNDLANIMLSSSLCLYPNNFWETFCLTALETQASGTPMITTDIGALNTTLSHNCNILIEDNPFGESYKKKFIDETIKLIKNKNKMKKYSDKCINYFKDVPDWKEVTKRWENIIYYF